MHIRGVVHDQINQHSQAALFTTVREFYEIAKGTVPRIDAIVIGNIITVVTPRRGIKGHQPYRGDAQALQIIEPAHQTFEIANAVAVGIQISANRQTVNNRVFVPEIVYHSPLSDCSCCPSVTVAENTEYR